MSDTKRFFRAAIAAALLAAPCVAAALDQDASPWGMGTSAEWSGQYPRFNPLLRDAGVRWLRLFPEWPGNEPKPGQWTWDSADSIVANARANNLRVTGFWGYFAPWASADGGTRKGPIKDLQLWRDYVAASAARYQRDIQYWEVWNEFNGSFYQGKDKPKEYAELVVAAYDAARKVDPAARIGMSVANFDVGFLDAAIKAGAAGHFDYICVHPYENLAAVAENGEVGYLSLAANLREMLQANKQPVDTPLWITEFGCATPIKPDPKGDAHEAEMLVKGYVLSLAQGFQRVFWFEARGPSYGGGCDLGIIRADWTPRPAYDALKTMTRRLGPEPRYLGWLDLGPDGFGFVFQQPTDTVLVAWAPSDKACRVAFPAAVQQTDLAGAETALAAGKDLVLTRTPVFIGRLPAGMAQQAHANLSKPYPWGGDYAHAATVTCHLGALNKDDGLKQVNPKTTIVVNDLTATCRRTDFNNRDLHGEGHYVYFRVTPQFVPYGTTNLEITIVAKRIAPERPAGMLLCYESQRQGYTGAPERWVIPADDQWHEQTWTLHDANFVGQWGWNFRFDAAGSANAFDIREVRVRKVPR